MSKAHYTLLDQTGEKSGVSIPGQDMTAANHDAILAAELSLRNAVKALTIGTLAQSTLQHSVREEASSLPGNNHAQREMKLLVIYQDDTTEKQYSCTIPTIDLSLVEFTPGGGDAVSLTSPAAMAAFVTEFESFARSPEVPANTVSIVKARVVGRNI